MQAFNIQFQIYADGVEEVEELRKTIVDFINEHRAAGRAVTAKKCSNAIKKWRDNVFIKNQVIDYFK